MSIIAAQLGLAILRSSHADTKQLRYERIYPSDVDGTLIEHLSEKTDKTIEVQDFVTGKTILVVPNEPMIRILKEEYARGAFVIVWSKGGNQWANDVVNALGIRDYVHLIMTKPSAYGDDKPVESWLTDRIFIPYTEPYKLEGTK